jgi:magnesium chelatase family protein
VGIYKIWGNFLIKITILLLDTFLGREPFMLCRVRSSVLSGLTAYSVDVEVEASEGKHSYTTIGMGDIAVRESKDRVLSAIKKCGVPTLPKILVNLAPAELKKEGSAFDLAIAVGILGASWRNGRLDLQGRSFVGELSLNGEIKPVRGIVAHAIEAVEMGLDEIIVARENEAEARLVSGITVTAMDSLVDLIAYLCGELVPEPSETSENSIIEYHPKTLLDVRGQKKAKRAMEIAAAGGHNLLMVGPPGCGKSMLAERFASLLPPLSRNEMLEVAKIHSVAGLPLEELLAGIRPFRNPHHVISEPGLVGGGSIPRPGEVSLAHHGVLFLDEFPEFKRGVLEALRQPLESGRVRVSRAKSSIEYPAMFQLIAAMNPCPCGRLGVSGSSCMCSRGAIYSYLKKLSLPILDRIDLHVEVEAVPFTELSCTQENNEDLTIAERVLEARERAYHRAKVLNARISSADINEHVRPKASALELLKRMTQKTSLSARGYFRILKVARTIADLRGGEHVNDEDIAEASSYRTLHRIEQYCMGGS